MKPACSVSISVIVAVLSSDALGQATGPQGTGPNPTTNPATPMQQLPSGTNPGSAAANMSDRDFVMAAAINNKFEVIEGQLALTQASDPKLKEIAQIMIKDHEAALGELRAAARAAGVTLPADIAPDATHQAKINAIRNRKGSDFDQAYRTDLVQSHDQALALLDTYSRTGGNEQLKAWATKSLAVVRRHQQHLEKLGMGGAQR
jgi:putative membrane protein